VKLDHMPVRVTDHGTAELAPRRVVRTTSAARVGGERADIGHL
jgi:hypothetical protein